MKFAFVLIIPLSGSVAQTIVFILLAAWATLGPRRAIEALTLSWLTSFLNPALYPPALGDDVLRWVVIAAALVSVLVQTVRSGFMVPRAWVWVAGFVATAASLALTVSYAVDVSLFKLLSFLMGTTAVLLGYHLTRAEAEYWKKFYFGLFVVVVVIGFPLIVHPIGYALNGRGFQGLLNHPQTYTVFIGPLLAWHLARLAYREIRGPWMWLVAVFAIVSLIATKGRTGVLAAGGSLILAGIWWLASGRMRLSVPKGWIGTGLLVIGLSGAWIGINWQDASNAVRSFTVKGQEGRSIEESFYGSRGFLLERSWLNFRDQPLTGIGFGVASDPTTFNIRRDPLLGLPVGASTEKGFALVAVLEEVGLIGFSVFLLMLFAVLRPALSQHGSFPAAVLSLSALMVNFGEAVLFAFAGSGMLVWLLIGVARITGVRNR